jgi:hypothetical protein
MASRVDEYRRLAQECLEMSRTIASEETRASLVEMAQVWLRLAEERVEKQQQQSQPKTGDKE